MAKQHSQKRSKLERANQINTSVHQITLSSRDAAMFIAMLENPPEPNAAVVKAFAHRKSMIENGYLISNFEVYKSVRMFGVGVLMADLTTFNCPGC